MNYCTKCGSPVEPGSKFCTHCGADLTAMDADQATRAFRPQEDPQATRAFNANADTQAGGESGWINVEENDQTEYDPNGQAPDPDGEDEDNSKMNQVLLGILIGLLIIGIALGAFFLVRHNQEKKDTKNDQKTEQQDKQKRPWQGQSSGELYEASIKEYEPSAEQAQKPTGLSRDGDRILLNGSLYDVDGLVTVNGITYLVDDGIIQRNFSGVYTVDGTSYIISNGMLMYSYDNKTVTINDKQYTVKDGALQGYDSPSRTVYDGDLDDVDENGDIAEPEDTVEEAVDVDLDLGDNYYKNDAAYEPTAGEIGAYLKYVYVDNDVLKANIILSNETELDIKGKDLSRYQIELKQGDETVAIFTLSDDMDTLHPGEDVNIELTLEDGEGYNPDLDLSKGDITIVLTEQN